MVSLAIATVIFESGLTCFSVTSACPPPSRSVPGFFPEIPRETGVEPGTKSHHTLSAGREDRLKKCRNGAEPLRGTGLAYL